MTLLQLHYDEPRTAVGQGRLAFARVIRRMGAAFRLMHRAIVVAKTRRLRNELMFHANDRDNVSSAEDAMRYPQYPLILGDKWDF
jgi:hypothetical protein